MATIKFLTRDLHCFFGAGTGVGAESPRCGRDRRTGNWVWSPGKEANVAAAKLLIPATGGTSRF